MESAKFYKTEYQRDRDARAEDIVFKNKLWGALNPKAFFYGERDEDYIDKNYAYRICAMEDVFYGMPLLVKHLEELKSLLENMNERAGGLRNAVHAGGTGDERLA